MRKIGECPLSTHCRHNTVLQDLLCGPSWWMRTTDSLRLRKPRKARRDGWTPLRQLQFLDLLAATGSVTKAAAGVRMSRDSAYRLRSRLKGELFVLAWDRLMQAKRAVPANLSKVITVRREMPSARSEELRRYILQQRQPVELKGRAPCPSPGATAPVNRACSGGPGSRGGRAPSG